MLGSSSVAAKLSASQEGLSSVITFNLLMCLTRDKGRQALKSAIYINAVNVKEHGHSGRENAQEA
jgi:hypothetical protein